VLSFGDLETVKEKGEIHHSMWKPVLSGITAILIKNMFWLLQKKAL
jgi:hypothetical protein